jgi:predicted nucleic acid-binding protein
MPVEPGVIDTNILVYAVNADSQQHAASRALLEAARDPATTLYVTSQILCEFYSVVTNPRRISVTALPAEALQFISLCWRFLVFMFYRFRQMRLPSGSLSHGAIP